MIFFKLASPEKITQIYLKSTDKYSSKLHIKNRFDVFQVNRYSTLSLSNNEFDRSKPWQMNEADHSIAVLRVMFDLGLKKKYSAYLCVAPWYCDFNRSLTSTFIDH